MALLLVAALSRLIALGALEPWYDEACSYLGAVQSSWTDLLQWRVYANPEHSPLPFVESRIAMDLLGRSLFALRLPAALYGIASVMLLYVGIGRLASWRAGFFAALLLAMHPCALEWSREARMYSGWLFATIALLFVTMTALRRTVDHRRSAWLWWIAMGLLFMFSHAQTIHAISTIAGTALAVLIAAVRQMRKKRYDNAGRFIAGLGVASLAYVCNWSGIGLLKLETVEGASETHLPLPLLPPLDHVTGMIGELGGYMPLWFGIVLWLIAAFGLVLLARKHHARLAMVILVIGCAPIALYPSIAAKHFYASRYLLVMLIPLCAGLGVAAAWCWQKRTTGKAAVVIAFALFAVAWQPVWRDLYINPKNRVAGAIAAIAEQSRPGDVIKVIPAGTWVFFGWHDHGAATLRTDANGENATATWLLVGSPRSHQAAIADALQARGHDAAPFFAELPADAGWLSVRISKTSIGPITVVPPGRTHQCRLYRLDE